MQSTDEDEFLMTTHAARELEVAPQTIILWNNQGKLSAIRTANGVRLYKRQDIERLKRERAERKRA
jgi:DNA-binding transcriptional MerR regulator